MAGHSALDRFRFIRGDGDENSTPRCGKDAVRQSAGFEGQARTVLADITKLYCKEASLQRNRTALVGGTAISEQRVPDELIEQVLGHETKKRANVENMQQCSPHNVEHGMESSMHGKENTGHGN